MVKGSETKVTREQANTQSMTKKKKKNQAAEIERNKAVKTAKSGSEEKNQARRIKSEWLVGFECRSDRALA